MTHVSADRVKDTTTSTGTGNITVSGTADPGFKTLSDRLTVDGDTGDFAIVAVDGSGAPTGDWETSTLTRISANVYSRAVIESSNGDALVNFSAGTKQVFLTATGRNILPRVFVQQTRPTSNGPWAWWETDVDGDIVDLTINNGL